MSRKVWIGIVIGTWAICISSSAHAERCAAQINASSVTDKLNSIIACMQKHEAALEAEISAAEKRAQALEEEIRPLREILDSAVIAFYRSERGGGACPRGWSLFKPAGGRMIIGAGQHQNLDQANNPLTEYPSFQDDTRQAIGGEEEVALTVKEMPNHKHLPPDDKKNPQAQSYVTQSELKSAHGSMVKGDLNNPFQLGVGFLATGQVNNHPGKITSHNNMPPYIALYFCKKD